MNERKNRMSEQTTSHEIVRGARCDAQGIQDVDDGCRQRCSLAVECEAHFSESMGGQESLTNSLKNDIPRVEILAGITRSRLVLEGRRRSSKLENET